MPEQQIMAQIRYSMVIAWSPEDNMFIGQCPEMPGVTAHGDTHLIAALSLRSAIELAVETLESDKDHPLPKPLFWEDVKK